MLCRDHNIESRVSVDARGLSGLMLCILLPLFSWFGLQDLTGFRLTSESWVSGEWHTLWTGHLLHYTLEHFIWDALMFVVFAVLLWREERWRVWLWLMAAAPMISVFVFVIDPQLEEYRGLSALDTMLFVRFCLGFASKASGMDRWLFGVLPLLALGAKIAYEFFYGSAFFVSDLGPGVVPLPSTHIAGLLIGAVWCAVSSHQKRSSR